MKHINITALTLLISTTLFSAIAAPPAPKPSYFDNAYLGGSLGVGTPVGRSRSTVTSNGNPPSIAPNTISVSQDLSGKDRSIGIIGGLNAGYNKVFDNERWLIGIDTLADLAHIESTIDTTSSPVFTSGQSVTYPTPSVTTSNSNSNGSLQSKISMKWSVGVGAKIGTIINNAFLFYTTAHWIGSKWQTQDQSQQSLSSNKIVLVFNTPGTLNIASKKQFKNGVRFGIGLATPITNNIIAGLDAGYTWYGQIKASNTTATSVTDSGGSFTYITTANHTHNPRLIDIKLKLAWQFNGVA